MTAMPHSIGIIVGSTRPGGNGRPITQWILRTICAEPGLRCTYTLIDLAELDLPLFNEPGVPAVHEPKHQHTKDWQKEIAAHDGFIFVTPQYNWGYPAVLKNAIDYLYHEWKGKPAAIVSYGGHGGGKGAAQLHQVLNGLRMRVVDLMPALTLARAQQAGGMTSEDAESAFADNTTEILSAARQLEDLVCGA